MTQRSITTRSRHSICGTRAKDSPYNTYLYGGSDSDSEPVEHQFVLRLTAPTPHREMTCAVLDDPTVGCNYLYYVPLMMMARAFAVTFNQHLANIETSAEKATRLSDDVMRVAIVGDPVEHSLSPVMQNAGAPGGLGGRCFSPEFRLAGSRCHQPCAGGGVRWPCGHHAVEGRGGTLVDDLDAHQQPRSVNTVLELILGLLVGSAPTVLASLIPCPHRALLSLELVCISLEREVLPDRLLLRSTQSTGARSRFRIEPIQRQKQRPNSRAVLNQLLLRAFPMPLLRQTSS